MIQDPQSPYLDKTPTERERLGVARAVEPPTADHPMIVQTLVALIAVSLIMIASAAWVANRGDDLKATRAGVSRIEAWRPCR